MLGLAIVTIASLARAVSPDMWVLIAFRSVQATGAAMLIPSSLKLVLTTMPPARVKRSVRLRARAHLNFAVKSHCSLMWRR